MRTKNQKRLISMKLKYGLSFQEIADITGRKETSVRAWLCDKDSKRYRRVGDEIIKLIEHEMKNRAVKRQWR